MGVPKNPLDDLEKLHNQPRGPKGCVARAIMEHPEHADLIIQAVDHTAHASTVSRFLMRDYEIDLSQQSINRHRRGDCSCHRRMK